MPPGSSWPWPVGVEETPMMKSRMPCQVAKPEMMSSISDATPIRVLRPTM